MVYIYLPSPCYIDGNSFRFPFFSPSLSLRFLPPLFSSHLSFHTIVFFIVGTVESKKMSGKKWNVSAIFSLRFDPALTFPPPVEAGCLFGCAIGAFWQKYWVSVTRISCCDRLTERALALRTLIQQRAALSGGNLPQAGRQRGHVLKARGDHCRRGTFWYFDP